MTIFFIVCRNDLTYWNICVTVWVYFSEMMAGREEKADLRAKVYLLEKEKSGLKMILEDRDCMEEVLRTRIQHLEEILDPNVLRHVEDQVLRQRINNLFDTLDKVSRNANERHKHAIDLIEDLRKANR